MGCKVSPSHADVSEMRAGSSQLCIWPAGYKCQRAELPLQPFPVGLAAAAPSLPAEILQASTLMIISWCLEGFCHPRPTRILCWPRWAGEAGARLLSSSFQGAESRGRAWSWHLLLRPWPPGTVLMWSNYFCFSRFPPPPLLPLQEKQGELAHQFHQPGPREHDSPGGFVQAVFLCVSEDESPAVAWSTAALCFPSLL